jgi:hypothetical protein
MPAGNQIALSSFAFEDFRPPVFAINLSLAEDIFPSITRLPTQWTTNSFQARTTQLVFVKHRLFAYEQN